VSTFRGFGKFTQGIFVPVGIRSWFPKAMALVVMVMVGVAVMASLDSVGTATTQPGLVASESSTPCDNPGIESGRTIRSLCRWLMNR
jgi:hypothetical protein